MGCEIGVDEGRGMWDKGSSASGAGRERGTTPPSPPQVGAGQGADPGVVMDDRAGRKGKQEGKPGHEGNGVDRPSTAKAGG